MFSSTINDQQTRMENALIIWRTKRCPLVAPGLLSTAPHAAAPASRIDYNPNALVWLRTSRHPSRGDPAGKGAQAVEPGRGRWKIRIQKSNPKWPLICGTNQVGSQSDDDDGKRTSMTPELHRPSPSQALLQLAPPSSALAIPGANIQLSPGQEPMSARATPNHARSGQTAHESGHPTASAASSAHFNNHNRMACF